MQQDKAYNGAIQDPLSRIAWLLATSTTSV